MTAVEHAADAQLKVGTFNIRNSGAKDGDNAWPRRRPILIETVRRANPDLVGYQEVLPDQQAQLAVDLPDYASVATFRDDGKAHGEAVSIFYRKSRFDLLDSGTFWLSQTPDVPGSFGWDAACTRICTWARLSDKLTGQTVLAGNTHFDHEGKQARLNAAKLIIERLAKLDRGDAVLLTGDFNAVETGPEYAALLHAANAEEMPLVDVHRVVHPTRAPDELSCHWFSGSTEGERIDWIFCSRQFSPVESAIDWSTSPDGRLPSDHFPIWATLRFTAVSNP